MALFKPAAKESSGNNSKYTGICQLGIVGFKDRSSEFDWADVYLEVEVAVKDSEYTRNIRIKGSFEKDVNGTITGGSVINRVYKFFGDIQCSAGINMQGKWESEDGTPINDIASYLNDNYSENNMPGVDPEHKYVGYIYKELNKKTGSTYNVVHHRLFPNTSKGNVDLADHVKWMKSNGFIKEASVKPSGSTNLSTTAADVL